MDMAIDSLLAGADRARAAFDVAALAIAGAGVVPPATGEDPAGPPPVTGAPAVATVDVAEQLTAMMVASQVHQATLAALRSAMASYRASVDLLRV